MRLLLLLCLLTMFQLTNAWTTGVLEVTTPKAELQLQFSCSQNCSFRLASLDPTMSMIRLIEESRPGLYKYRIGEGPHIYQYQNLELWYLVVSYYSS